MAKDYLVHYGILGQKWGVRRFQNEDGTLTAAGKERYGSEDTPWSGKSSEEAKRLAQQRDLDRARYEALIYKDRYNDNDDEDHTKLSRKDITKKVLDARNDVRKVAREHWKEILVGGAIAAALIQKFKGKKASTIASPTSSFYPNMARAKDIVWNKRFEPAGLLGAGKYPNMAGMREAVPIWTKRPANAAGLLTAPDRNSTASILKRVTHKIVGHDGMEGGITTDYILHCNRSESELYHYGILGQKWGVRNGPPYPLDRGDYSSSERKYINADRVSTKEFKENVKFNYRKEAEELSELHRELSKKCQEFIDNSDEHESNIAANIIKSKRFKDAINNPDSDMRYFDVREAMDECFREYQPFKELDNMDDDYYKVKSKLMDKIEDDYGDLYVSDFVESPKQYKGLLGKLQKFMDTSIEPTPTWGSKSDLIKYKKGAAISDALDSKINPDDPDYLTITTLYRDEPQDTKWGKLVYTYMERNSPGSSVFEDYYKNNSKEYDDFIKKYNIT